MPMAIRRDGRATLRRFVLAHLRLPLREFLARQPHPFLLLSAGQALGMNESGSHTAITVPERPVPDLDAPTLAPEPEDPLRDLILQVAPRARAPLDDHIRVGRSRRNDVVLRFEQVSKSHAYFAPRSGGPGLALVDAGSTNGTTVNHLPLRPGEPRDVEDGDEIDFGAGLAFAYLTAPALHRLLPLLARRLRLPVAPVAPRERASAAVARSAVAGSAAGIGGA